MVAGSHLAIQTGRVFLTLTLVLAVEIAVVSLAIIADMSLLPNGVYYPWGRAVGETAGAMMIPAFILWLCSLFQRSTVFLVASVLVSFGWPFLAYQGSIIENTSGKAVFDGLLAAAGSAVAITVIVLRMRGKWKSRTT